MHASPISTTRPTWTKMLASPPVHQTPSMAASKHMGTIRITASGITQLSYNAASTRNTSSKATGNTTSAALPWLTCWKLRSVHSISIPGGSALAATDATVARVSVDDSMAGSD